MAVMGKKEIKETRDQKEMMNLTILYAPAVTMAVIVSNENIV